MHESYRFEGVTSVYNNATSMAENLKLVIIN